MQHETGKKLKLSHTKFDDELEVEKSEKLYLSDDNSLLFFLSLYQTFPMLRFFEENLRLKGLFSLQIEL